MMTLQFILACVFVGIGSFMLLKKYWKENKFKLVPNPNREAAQSVQSSQQFSNLGIDSDRLICLKKLDDLMDCVESQEMKEYLAKNLAPEILLKKK